MYMTAVTLFGTLWLFARAGHGLLIQSLLRFRLPEKFGVGHQRL